MSMGTGEAVQPRGQRQEGTGVEAADDAHVEAGVPPETYHVQFLDHTSPKSNCKGNIATTFNRNTRYPYSPGPPGGRKVFAVLSGREESCLLE
jgi:hypothetical protein